MSPSRRSDFSRDPCRLSRLKPLLHERQTENCIALQEGRVGRRSVLHSTVSLPPTDGEDSNREKPSRCGSAAPRRCGVCVRTVDGRVPPAYGSICSLKTREDIPDSHAAGGVRPVWPVHGACWDSTGCGAASLLHGTLFTRLQHLSQECHRRDGTPAL